MNEVKHTPLPWKLIEGHDKVFIENVDTMPSPYHVIAQLDYYTFNNESPKDNAAFIVKAVNNHYTLTEQRDELLEALKSIISAESEAQMRHIAYDLIVKAESKS